MKNDNSNKIKLDFFFFSLPKIFQRNTQEQCQRQHFSVSFCSSCPGNLSSKGLRPTAGEPGGACSGNSEVRGRGWQNVALGSCDKTALPNENVTKVRQTRVAKWRS